MYRELTVSLEIEITGSNFLLFLQNKIKKANDWFSPIKLHS